MLSSSVPFRRLLYSIPIPHANTFRRPIYPSIPKASFSSAPFTMSNANAASRLTQLASHLTPENAPGKSPLVGQLLADQVSIITGSGQGIGRSAAILFAAHGSKVVVSDLDGKKADAVVQEITSAGGQAIAVAGNVMDDAFADKLIKTTVEKFGKINHIVNNAGFTK